MHTQDIEQVARPTTSPAPPSSGMFWKIITVAALIIATGYLPVYSGVIYRTYPFRSDYAVGLSKGCELVSYGTGQVFSIRCPFWVVP